MGKFMDRFLPRPGVRQVPVIPPVPEGQNSHQNGTFIDARQRQIIVKICDGGKPEDLAVALGSLEMAKDIVKSVITQWHAAEKNQNAILVPKPNGGVNLNVQ
jgi:hypothetical protein